MSKEKQIRVKTKRDSACLKRPPQSCQKRKKCKVGEGFPFHVKSDHLKTNTKTVDQWWCCGLLGAGRACKQTCMSVSFHATQRPCYVKHHCQALVLVCVCQIFDVLQRNLSASQQITVWLPKKFLRIFFLLSLTSDTVLLTRQPAPI